MIIKIVAFTVMWPNTFLMAGGSPDTYSPRNIIVGIQLDHAKHCRLPSRAYTQVHDDLNPLNTTNTPHSTPSICLSPTSNARGSSKILNLDTG